MPLFHIFVLAAIQGLTEFLPISSSAHLILTPWMSGWTDQGLSFDIAVHVGTLTAVIYYFRTDLADMVHAWLRSLHTREQTRDSRLAWAVIIGTIPLGVAGLLLINIVETALRSPLVIAWATIGFGVLLWWADAAFPRVRDEHGLGWKEALAVGCAQALALVPGTSRSGITITAGRLLGLTRKGAARFSFLLSIPAILFPGLLSVVALAQGANVIDWNALAIGALISGFSAFLCIHFFLKLVDRVGMLPFVIYRIVLGVVLLVLFA